MIYAEFFSNRKKNEFAENKFFNQLKRLSDAYYTDYFYLE